MKNLPDPAFFLLPLFLLIAPTGRGQDFTGKTVISVQYDPPRQPLDARDLKNMVLVEAGQPLNTNQVAATIDRLYTSGMYSNVAVDAEASGAGVTIKFITQSKLFIGHVQVNGKSSDPPSKAIILSTAQLNLGAAFDQAMLATAKQSILDLMHENGLFEAAVQTVTVANPDTEQIGITLNVTAGKRARYQTPVIQGDTKLPNETIIKATGWRIRFIKRWRKVTEELTDKGTAGVQKKYQKQNRLTASVNVSALDYDPGTNRATPTLQIDAGPKITLKAAEAKISKGKLRTYVPVYEEGAADNDLLTEGARNIQSYFQSQGYPDADITFRRSEPSNDEEVITFYITKGERRKLVKVDIEGATYFQLDTLRERMFLQPAKMLILPHGRYSEAFRKKDAEAIENLYQANGFRDVNVTSTVVANYKGKASDLAVTYSVNQGPQWRIGKLTVEGQGQLKIDTVIQQLSCTNGQPYSEVDIASDRNRILEYYYSQGFPNATFTYTTAPAGPANTVNLTYYITEGRREYIRNILLSGLLRTHRSIVDRKIKVKPGEPVSIEKISSDAQSLSQLGVFATINSAVQDADGTNQYKDVLFDFHEAARYSYQIGVGAAIGTFGSTTTNLQQAGGSTGFSPRFSFNINRLDFLGLGQTISLQTLYSSLENRASLNYIVPNFLNSHNRTVTFSVLYDTTRDVATFSAKREQASVQTSFRLSKPSTLLVRFDYRRVSTSNVVIPSLLIPQLLQPVRIGIISTSYIQDHRDDPANAHRGYWNTLDTGIADGALGSQRDFIRALGRQATYTPIGKNLVFARQTQIGIIKPFNSIPGLSSEDYIPLPERFFGGGPSSMRGFGYNEAGPRDIGTPTAGATGFPLGGNALFFNTFELRFPLLGQNIGGVFFEDMGNVYTNFSNISLAYHQSSNQNFNYAVQAPGFGIRYKTPLGPIRLDFAYALNPSKYVGYSGTIQQLITCSDNGQLNKVPGCTSEPQQLSHFTFSFSIGQAF
ncbi:MAG TPA: POTRA domain-containing protein [Bryobacteraceae bacterium]|jgi:outer membrane protein assembly complex protein YaeT|nr:POTRA domain-containing protein [Bryobacteraceae bacterium]